MANLSSGSFENPYLTALRKDIRRAWMVDEHRCDACGEYIDDHLPSIECPNSTVNRTDEGETV